MKTILPASITTIDGAKSFLTDLYNNGEAWHPEDDANDIYNGDTKLFTKEESVKLNALMEQVYSLPGVATPNEFNHVFDPCLFLLEMDPEYQFDTNPAEVSEENKLLTEVVYALDQLPVKAYSNVSGYPDSTDRLVAKINDLLHKNGTLLPTHDPKKVLHRSPVFISETFHNLLKNGVLTDPHYYADISKVLREDRYRLSIIQPDGELHNTVASFVYENWREAQDDLEIATKLFHITFEEV